MKFFSLFSGAKCFNCGQDGHYFCPLCIPRLEIYDGFDYISKKKSKNFSISLEYRRDFPIGQIIVLTHYHQKGVKKLLRHAKFYGKYQAYRDLIFPFSAFFRQHIDSSHSLFVPVPLHFLRYWKRGFNQSEKISLLLSEIINIPIETKLLYRRKYTIHQSKLTKSQREIMLYSAFGVKNTKNIEKNTILYLVDDVVSSGSTLLECAKTLRDAGFMDIRAVVLASD